MVIEKYEVLIGFQLALIKDDQDSHKLCLELNRLFNDMVKAWAKDKNAIVTTPKTSLESDNIKW